MVSLEMLSTRNLNRASLDSLSSEYLSDQSPDDLSLLNRLNSLLSSNNLPKLSNILDVTPSLLIALYESLPPFQRVPYVDPTALGFATRLRNMKLLTGSIASGRYGLLTLKTRQALEELDLPKFCERDPDAVRDVVTVVVDVAERGRLVGVSMAGPETPKSKNSGSIGAPRSLDGTKRSSGNDMEGSPTPRKKRPILVLPAVAKTDDSGSSVFDKDSGWDGSTLEVLSQTDKVGDDDKLIGAGDFSGPQIPDLVDAKSKRRKAARIGRSSPPKSSASSSCSSISPGFLEQLSARVNAIVARCPAPSPYNKQDLESEGEEEDSFDTPRQQRVMHGNYPNLKGTLGKSLFTGRVDHGAKTDQFGGALKALSQRQDEKKPNEDPTERGSSINRLQKKRAEKEADNKSWVTEDGRIDPPLPPPLSAKGVILSSSTEKIPAKGSGWDAEGAVYIPLPTSRPASTTSRYSRQGNDFPSKSPLPFPPSLLRTMHWATSLPTPPLSPTAQREQKTSSRLAPPVKSSNITPRTAPKSHLPKPRRVVTVTPLSGGTHKWRAPGKRHSSGGSRTTLLKGSGNTAVKKLQEIQDDGDEWVSVDSQELSLENITKQATSTPLPQDDLNETSFSSAAALALAKDEVTANDDLKGTYGRHWSNGDDGDDGDDDDDTDDDDRTSIYSVSTVSWGEDDPFTAALRQKRQLAFEKLKAVERSFDDEIENKRRERMEGRENSLADRLRWRTYSYDKQDQAEFMEGGESTDSEGGVTDVEEELKLLEEIGKREAVRQGLLLRRLMERGT